MGDMNNCASRLFGVEGKLLVLMLSRLFFLAWFLWGVDYGVGYGVFLIWRCCAENHPFAALASSLVFS